MLKRSFEALSKVRGVTKVSLKAATLALSVVPNKSFSSLWNNKLHFTKSLNTIARYNFATLPVHTKLAMPALSPTMEQGNIIKWNFKEGDKVDVGDQICDIETDKATLGFEMQDAGYIAKILFPDGTKGVKVGTPIVIIVENEADLPKFADYKPEAVASSAPPQQTITPVQSKPKPAQSSEVSHHSENFKGVPRSNVLIKFPRGNRGEHGASASSQDRVFASPIARRIAKEKNFDLTQIKGSGPHGRILKHDVESYVPKQISSQAEAKSEKAQKAKAQPAVAPTGQYTDVPISSMRETIAKTLLQSKTTIPHYYLKTEIFMDEIISMREKLNKEAKSKITFNDIFIKASALASRDVPELNSHWHDTFIRKYNNVDVAIAVDTGTGIMTPVIFSVNKKGLNEISLSAKDLVEKSRTNKLQHHEYTGGTFGLSNVGMYGTTGAKAIISPPLSGVLAVSQIKKKVVPDGEGYKEVSVLQVTLSCDHRVVDGAKGAKWLQVFKNYLEKPYTMLL